MQKLISRHVSSRIDYVVMEDLFWKKDSIETVYDLKGSQRNRLTKETSHHGQKVLLDTNYLSSIVESPIYLNQSAHLVLMGALKYDVEFLASHHIIDYSLLVGVDWDGRALVVGIIDFIILYYIYILYIILTKIDAY